MKTPFLPLAGTLLLLAALPVSGKGWPEPPPGDPRPHRLPGHSRTYHFGFEIYFEKIAVDSGKSIYRFYNYYGYVHIDGRGHASGTLTRQELQQTAVFVPLVPAEDSYWDYSDPTELSTATFTVNGRIPRRRLLDMLDNGYVRDRRWDRRWAQRDLTLQLSDGSTAKLRVSELSERRGKLPDAFSGRMSVNVRSIEAVPREVYLRATR